jgi:hypothetical protein
MRHTLNNGYVISIVISILISSILIFFYSNYDDDNKDGGRATKATAINSSIRSIRRKEMA